MSRQTNSGKYVTYIDARSTSRANGIVFSSASAEALSSIIKNQSFYSQPIVYVDISQDIELKKEDVPQPKIDRPRKHVLDAFADSLAEFDILYAELAK